MTLFNVLFNIIKLMAPFAPFLAEHMYQYLKVLTDTKADSVHYLMLPEANKSLIDKTIERAVSRMQSVIELGRILRDRKTIPIKYPLPEIVVVHQDDEYIDDIKSLETYILLELNVRKLTLTTDKSKFGITLRAEPDFKVLGLRLKQDFKAVTTAIKALTDSEINDIVKEGYVNILGKRIELSEIRLIFKADDVASHKYEVLSDNDVLVLLDLTPDSSMQQEGVAREIINRIQKLRKKAHLVPTDEISVIYKASGELAQIAIDYKEFIETAIQATFTLDRGEESQKNVIIIEQQQQLKGNDLHLVLRGTKKVSNNNNVDKPVVNWLNIELYKLNSLYGSSYKKGMVLIPKGTISLATLKSEIATIFGLYSNFDLWSTNGCILNDDALSKLNGSTIFVTHPSCALTEKIVNSKPFCKFINFKENDLQGTLLLENPSGIVVLKEQQYKNVITKWETIKN